MAAHKPATGRDVYIGSALILIGMDSASANVFGILVLAYALVCKE